VFSMGAVILSDKYANRGAKSTSLSDVPHGGLDVGKAEGARVRHAAKTFLV